MRVRIIEESEVHIRRVYRGVKSGIAVPADDVTVIVALQQWESGLQRRPENGCTYLADAAPHTDCRTVPPYDGRIFETISPAHCLYR